MNIRYAVRASVLAWIVIFCVLFLAFGCAATPPQSGVCLDGVLECRLAELEREFRESEDLAIMCRRNPGWAICK